MTLNKYLSSFITATILLSTVHAEEIKPNEAELISYSAQKYRVDYNAQSDKTKSDIANEYIQNAKLGDLLLGGAIKEDVNFKIASRQIAIEIWAQKFMQSTQVNEDQLKEMYSKLSPKMQPSYNLRNILHKSEADADKVMKTLKEIKDKKKQSEKFKQLSLSESEDFLSRKNGGKIGWVDANKLDPIIQSTLKEKKQGDIVKVEVKNIGWQILLIDEIKPERPATLEEAKGTLIQIAKQEMLNQEIKKLIESK
jgi:parvulin-like peptidyl-prolyl isomerase